MSFNRNNKGFLQDVLDNANKRRHNIIKPDNIRLLELTEGRVPTTKNFGNFWNSVEKRSSVSISDAVADAQDFFGLLRDMYGGYLYYGGDKVFTPVLDNIIAAIENRSDDATSISLSEFENILFSHLSTVNIVDKHFNIGDKLFAPSVAFYHAPEDFAFERDERGFKCLRCGKYATGAAGCSLDEIMRLHLTQEGIFVYVPVILHEEETLPDKLMIEFTYDDGTRDGIDFLKENPLYIDYRSPSLQYIEGFPVVNISFMSWPESMTHSYAQHARDFLSFAPKLRDEPVVIVDIRSNRGGNGLLAREWLHTLTGEIVPNNYVELKAQVWDFSKQYGTPEDHSYISSDISQKYRIPELFGEGYMIFGNTPDRIIEWEQVFILLVDRHTASAGEGFTDMVLSMSNSLIVGSHTYGVLNFDTLGNFQMPRSGLSFGFGAGMHVFPEDHLIEGVGIAPDVWVAGDALNAVIKMLQRND